MDRGHDVGVVGKRQRRELRRIGPEDRVDDQQAPRVGRPDRPDRGEHDVIPGRVELAARFVEELERDRVRATLVAGRNLRPEGGEAIPLPGDVGGEIVIGVHVHNDGEIRRRRLVQDCVDPAEERGVDRVRGRRRGMAAEADRYPDVVEAPPCDEREIPGLNHAAPIAFVRRFQPIAEVDALLEVRRRAGRHAEDERLGAGAIAR